MTTRIKFRRGTASEWNSVNPTLSSGEPGLETDTGKIKVGNGTSNWTSLTYVGGLESLRLQDLSDVTSTAPSINQVLKWNGSAWAPGTDNNSVTSVNGQTGAVSLVVGVSSVNGSTGTVTLGMIGDGQTWELVRDNRDGTVIPTRDGSTWYQNTTGKPIMVTVWGSVGGVGSIRIGPSTTNYVEILTPDGDSGEWQEIDPIIVPKNHYYMVVGTGIEKWWELK